MTPDEIKAWYRERGLTQEQFARLLNVSLRTVQGWVLKNPKGRPAPYLERALRDLDRELKGRK